VCSMPPGHGLEPWPTAPHCRDASYLHNEAISLHDRARPAGERAVKLRYAVKPRAACKCAYVVNSGKGGRGSSVRRPGREWSRPHVRSRLCVPSRGVLTAAVPSVDDPDTGSGAPEPCAGRSPLRGGRRSSAYSSPSGPPRQAFSDNACAMHVVPHRRHPPASTKAWADTGYRTKAIEGGSAGASTWKSS